MKNIENIKMDMPPHYHWLLYQNTPRVIQEALNLYGIYEWRGDDHNPAILQWAKDLGSYVGIDYNRDEIPWCGLYVGICVHRADFTPPKILVRAKEWLKFGTVIDRADASLGDVLVFERKGGGHVGFYVGHDDTHYHVLGGNQSNQVNIMRLDKKRCIGVRRCPWKFRQPDSVVPIKLANVGKVSDNEA